MIPRLASRLTFRQLQVFQAVYLNRSYSKAGAQLGLTQPAVSSQIRQLEETLGLPLFEYVGRRLFVTSAGETLVKHAEQIFGELEHLQSDINRQRGVVAGELRLVAVSTAQYVVPYLLRAFLNLHPDVKTSVSVVNRATALQRLEENKDDLVIMGMVPDDKPLVALPFLNNELIPVVPPGHPLLQNPSPKTQDFLNSELLLREPGSGSRLALEHHCQLHRLRLHSAMELGSNAAVKHAVMAGLGVAVLPRLSVMSELRLGALEILKLPGFPLNRSWCLVYPQAKYPTPTMRAFVEYVQQNLKQLEDFFGRHAEIASSTPNMTGNVIIHT